MKNIFIICLLFNSFYNLFAQVINAPIIKGSVKGGVICLTPHGTVPDIGAIVIAYPESGTIQADSLQDAVQCNLISQLREDAEWASQLKIISKKNIIPNLFQKVR